MHAGTSRGPAFKMFESGIRETGLTAAKVDTATGGGATLTFTAPVGMWVDLERAYLQNSYDVALANSPNSVDAGYLSRVSSLQVNSSRNLIRGSTPGIPLAAFSPYRHRHWFRSAPVYLPANQSIVFKIDNTSTGFAGQLCGVIPCIADQNRGEMARPADLVAEIRRSQLVQLPLGSTYAALDGSQEDATTDSGGIVDLGSLSIIANFAPTSNYQQMNAVDALQVADIVTPANTVFFYGAAGVTFAIPGGVWGPKRIGYRGIDFGLFRLSNNQAVGVKAATAYAANASGCFGFQLWTSFSGESIGATC